MRRGVLQGRNLFLVFLLALPFVNRLDAKVHRELRGVLDGRHLKEIVGQERFFGTPALVGVHGEELRDHLNGIFRHPLRVGKVRLERVFKTVGKRWLFWSRLEFLPQAALFINVGPVFLRRVPARAEDEIQLGGLVGALQKAGTTEHLGNDASNRPHVHFRRVMRAAQQQFGRTVPQSNDPVRQPLHVAVPAAGETPISNLQFALGVDEQIGSLEIAVDHFVAVHVVGATEELLGPRLDVILRKADLGRVENARQVVLHVLKHHEHVLWNRATLFCCRRNRNRVQGRCVSYSCLFR